MRFRNVYHRFRRIDWPGRTARSARVARGLGDRAFTEVVHAAVALARWLWRGGWNRFRLQRADRRRAVRRRDRARFARDGNFRAARLLVRDRDTDCARIPWRQPAL